MERPQHPSVYAVFALREVFFGGAGNFSSTGYKTAEGTPAMFTLSGIYTVNADCIMMQIPPTGSGVTPTFFGVIAADSNKIYQIRTDDGTETMLSRSARTRTASGAERIEVAGCGGHAIRVRDPICAVHR